MKAKKFPRLRTASEIQERLSNPQNLKCPFCGEYGFDKPGLKYHLQNYCNVYAQTKDLT